MLLYDFLFLYSTKFSKNFLKFYPQKKAFICTLLKLKFIKIWI